MGEWKPFIQRNRTYLVQNIDFKESELWDAVQSVGIVSRLQVDSMRSNNPANFRQVGAFIDHLLKRTKRDYDRFLYALIQTGQDHIAEYLNTATDRGRPLARAVEPFQQGGSTVSYMETEPQQNYQGTTRAVHGRVDAVPTELSPGMPVHSVIAPPPAPAGEIMDVEREIRNLPCDHNLIKCTPEFHQKQHKKVECYPVKNLTRGRAIVITMTGERKGWKKDVINMAKLFKFLEFDVEWHYDLKEKEYNDKLENFAQSDRNSHVDCAWVVLMGHGGNMDGKDYITSADSKPVFIKSTMEKIFNNKICLSLQQKPKTFIVQMCRGGEGDSGVKVTRSQIEKDAQKSIKLGTFTDYLFGYATQEGYAALRNIDEGSWYIQKLSKIFLEKSSFMSVMDMLQEVNREVQQFESEQGHVQTSEMTTTLSRQFYLFPGVNP